MANGLVLPFTVIVYFDGTSDTVSFDVDTDPVILGGGQFGPRLSPGNPSAVYNLSTDVPGGVTLQSIVGRTVTLQFGSTPTAGTTHEVFGNLTY